MPLSLSLCVVFCRPGVSEDVLDSALASLRSLKHVLAILQRKHDHPESTAPAES
jgi:hypothetical protein